MENTILLTNWKFKSPSETWLTAKVPGCIHSDLHSHCIIDDPFYGTNEKDLQWIDKRDWEYETAFYLDERMYNHSNLELEFSGLDTYANVYLNGQLILSADNMFRTWKIDVKNYIKQSNNTLRILFKSPIHEDLPKLEELGYSLPAANDDSEMGELGDKKVSVFARKAPYHYGWDWGPRFVTSGIWRKVMLRGWSNAHIEDVFIQQNQVSEESADLTVITEVHSDANLNAHIQITTKGIDKKIPIALKKGMNKITLDLTIANPELWWCNGLGDATLYNFSTSLFVEDVVLSQKDVRTGLRSAKLVRKKNKAGTSFYIELNGKPIFIKGANHIPNDSFNDKVTIGQYRHEIESAVKTNMNMLRVWGGGIYENDEFYQLCDEYGILIWQDFMFACSMYPGDDDFLESVEHEAVDNIKRLRNHPSIVLWCGNNEIDMAWSHYNEESGWGWKNNYTQEVRNKIWSDYEKIFHEILPEAVLEFSPGIDYWPSSPMCGLTGDETQHSSNEATSGDIHYWGVWHMEEPLENFNKYVGRFMSEYGFQSFPEEKTVRTVAQDKDMFLESEVMLNHQKNNRGNQLINEYMQKYYKKPKDFLSFLYMSQVLQGEAMKIAIESHRRHKPYCMGTLYWQMNDCWPVASWASMDYFGRWKAAQYFVKRSYQDTIVSIIEKDNKVDVYVVSDKLNSFVGQIKWRLVTFYGDILDEGVMETKIESNSSKVIISLDRDNVLKDHPLEKSLLSVQLSSESSLLDEKQYYFLSLKEIELKKPTITVDQIEDNVIALRTDFIAKQVHLSTEEECLLSDNYFDLVPGEIKLVEFDQQFDLHDLKIRTMYDYIENE
ncbi:beta-mannosidase [Natronobacillus azotifigens]|uniref:Beta-mannosidase n=1 Tax=Natronobacillus azotifigens TaxID=472978 RepID=A0A9J6RCK9_9BACI|nr:glycoside hydrolase family 2 protein [Natronobacillus azotifigens]MCZ0703091.1 glycoside hydrolase family 2 protein [Natronobacillus azotifigens]